MALKLVGLVGSYNRPSKTFALVETIVKLSASRYGLPYAVHDLHDVGPSLGVAQSRNELDEKARAVIDDIVAADALVIGSPTYKGSYPGMFKHLIDLVDPRELRGKPIIISATGGGDRHALMVEHQLRPLFGFFMSHTVPTAIYASDRDFTDYEVSSDPLFQRIEAAVDELGTFIPSRASALFAAE